jgi:Kdo2-lipid IVA lauroyltransferase/acyltransferase
MCVEVRSQAARPIDAVDKANGRSVSLGSMKRVSHLIEYCFLRILEAVITVLPRRLSLGIGALAGSALYHAGVYRRVVDRNFDHVDLFHDIERTRIIRRLYKNIGRYAVDMLRAGRPPRYTVENKAAVDAALDRGKGVLAVLAHFGNWELLAVFFGTVYPDLSVLARPMHNPLVERWLLAKRKKANVTPIYAAGALRKILASLKRNGIIAMLVDQYSAEQGTPAPFLGKTANTVRTAAGLVHRMECGVVLPYALIQKNGTYRVVIEPAPEVPVARDKEEAFITANLKAHNDAISRWILSYPDHYFGWFHKRFKDVISY